MLLDLPNMVPVTRIERETNIRSEYLIAAVYMLLALLTGAIHHSMVDAQHGRCLDIEWTTNDPSSPAQKWCTSTYGGDIFSANVQIRQY